MTPPGNESLTLHDLLEGGQDELMDYESDTEFYGYDFIIPSTPTCTDDSRHTPNPFPERGVADTLAALRMTPDLESKLVSNPLDEQQLRLAQEDESPQRRSRSMTTFQSHNDYVFTPPTVEERISQTVVQELAGWTMGPEATTPQDVVTRQSLRERYLEPHLPR